MWYEILIRVNNISKIWQKVKEKKARRKKRIISFEAADEPIDCAKRRFRIDFFTTMVDAIIQDTDTRFTALA